MTSFNRPFQKGMSDPDRKKMFSSIKAIEKIV